MTTISPTRSPLGLGSTIWTVIVAVLLVALAALAVYSVE
jgi:hypothetical protein